MRVFRFLQARPYWLYKVAGVLVVVAFVLTGVSGLLENSIPILYPLVMWVLPVGVYGSLGIAFLAATGGLIVYMLRKPRNGWWKHLGFAAFIVVFIVAGLAISGHSVPPLAHVSSLHYNDHVYNLTKTPLFSSLLVGDMSQVHILYECDNFGIICRALHEELLLVSNMGGTIRHPLYDVPTVIELTADAERNAISILVDGEVAYTVAL